MNDLLLLSLLIPGPQHGYALKKQAGLVTGQAAMHNNLVYPLLRRFVAKKWVLQKKAAGERGQTRRMYSLTPAGRRTLVERLGAFSDPDARSAESFHLRVGLFELLAPEARRNILDKRQAYLENRRARFAALESAMELDRYPKEAIRFLRERSQAELDWIAHLRRIHSPSQTKSKKRHGETR